MTKAYAVIGANYGDEGKGLITDYLCAQKGVEVVVRFNGGAQAGHTVVTPSGRRHVFHHIGSGSFAGAATFLSQFFVCNPILFTQEWKLLPSFLRPTVFVDERCLVTTPYDMLINQALERKRDNHRHGSCGVGFGETIQRAETVKHLAVTVGQIYRGIDMRKFWGELCDYSVNRAEELGLDDISIIGLKRCRNDIHSFREYLNPFYANIKVLERDQFAEMGVKTILFEGAQGLMLDQNNTEDFPYLTRSNTGLKNIEALCQSLSIRNVDAYYVTRTYLTRHGPGPLPGELETVPTGWTDTTNVHNEFQGRLRHARMGPIALAQRIREDGNDLARSLNVVKRLAVTCCDHRPTGRGYAYELANAFCSLGMDLNYLWSNGPTRNHVSVGGKEP